MENYRTTQGVDPLEMGESDEGANAGRREGVEPADAFGALSDPLRVEILQVLAAHHREHPAEPVARFSTLRRACSVRDSGRFRYHLERGSVTVGVGDRVECGQQPACCGNSGNTTEPHFHFHVQDHPNFFFGAGLPIRFESVRVDHPRVASETHDSAYVHAGQRVTHVGD